MGSHSLAGARKFPRGMGPPARLRLLPTGIPRSEKAVLEFRSAPEGGKARDMCGIFGIVGHPEASNLTYLGLHALQHRGQESAGIVASDGESLRAHREMGLVADIFTAPVIEDLPGGAAIGHVRYSTAGVSRLKNAQPPTGGNVGGPNAGGHNPKPLHTQE